VTSLSGPRPDPLEDWLAGQHRRVVEGLSRFLDSGAGLDETAIYLSHAAMASGFSGGLDTEAGLAAILPASAAAAINAADPGIRMALRRHPVILAVILSDLLVQALGIAETACSSRPCLPSEDTGGCGLDDAIDRARYLGDAVDRIHYSIPRPREPHVTETRAQRDNLSRASSRVLELTAALTARFNQVRSPVPGRGELSQALDRALEHARDRAEILGHDLRRDLDHHSGRDHTQVFGRALDPARMIAHLTAVTVGDVLGVGQPEGLAVALLDGMLDDFTQADLSRADLGGLILAGVRWSESGTVWPSGTDVDALRARSREVTPGTGIYVIAGPGDGSDRHGVPADR
jgi:hypothetical protein